MFYLFLAEGFEETEALVTLDMLRRAKIDVLTVGVTGRSVTGSHGISVSCDILISSASSENCSGVILPGGMPGTSNLFSSREVLSFVEYCALHKKLICAICAAPLILGRLGLLKNRQAVCFPGFENELTGALITDSPCVVSDNIITAKAAGAVFEFSYSIISYVKGESTAKKILNEVFYR